MYKYYNTDWTQLTISLENAVPQNQLVRLIDSFVDTIPLDGLLKNLANTGRPAYHPALLLKILLFGHSGRIFSGRNIELMLQERLPMMWLARNERISYHTINNFRSSDEANKLVKNAFIYFAQMLIDENLIIKENVTQSIEREHAQEAAGLEEIAKNTDA